MTNYFRLAKSVSLRIQTQVKVMGKIRKLMTTEILSSRGVLQMMTRMMKRGMETKTRERKTGERGSITISTNWTSSSSSLSSLKPQTRASGTKQSRCLCKTSTKESF